jgi:hypothetical protein
VQLPPTTPGAYRSTAAPPRVRTRATAGLVFGALVLLLSITVGVLDLAFDVLNRHHVRGVVCTRGQSCDTRCRANA